jgi:hypothetical protein
MRRESEMKANPFRATVSGSFRRAMVAVQAAVQELTDAGVDVLSPADPRVVDSFGDFVYVASDEVRRIRTVQGRHLAAIAGSDFVWLIAPDGYIGQSAAMEIGFAAAHEVSVFSTDVPEDLTLRQWVTVVRDAHEAVRRAGHPSHRPTDSVLIEPRTAIAAAHDDLVIVERGLIGTPTPIQTAEAEAASRRISRRLLVP